jgi:hypothetical protein
MRIAICLLFFITLTFAPFLISGCDSLVTGEELFRYSLDNRVGQPMVEEWKQQAEARTRIDGRTEYVFTRPNGCSWAMVVGEYDVIVAWYFISDPSLCKSKFSKGAQ